jgi:S-(hydroxymethyl)glutathione dehydrogenase / alcohol dehydrogenase
MPARDFLSGKKLQGALMGGNRFPVDIPRLVDFYLRGVLHLDAMIAARIALDDINAGFDAMRTGASARHVILFDQE